MKYIKQDNKYVTFYKLYNKTFGAFYKGTSGDFDTTGKIYQDYSDCKRALSSRKVNGDEDEYVILEFRYKLQKIEEK